jgi:hypothetical protein
MPSVGDRIDVHFGRDREGRFWWHSGDVVRGPFATENKAQKNAEATLFGPNVNLKTAADPNWDKKQ